MSPKDWLQHIILSLFYLTLTTTAQQYCDQCDCSISEKTGDGRGVRNVKPPCTEGKITWISPYGAVRIEFNPGFPDFEACFIIEASNLRAQVSQEIFDNSNIVLAERSTLQPLLTAKGRTGEHCIKSKSLPIILFIEPERTTESKGLNKIVFSYDIARKNSVFYFNPMEECRSCTEKELIRAYCSSDFVITAAMETLVNKEESKDTEISVNISRIIRQRNPDLFYRTSRKSQTIHGKVQTPRKCNISKGIGDYLFTGRLRLGKLHVTCASPISEWENVLHTALKSGTMECSLG